MVKSRHLAPSPAVSETAAICTIHSIIVLAAADQAEPDIEAWLSKWRLKHPEKDKLSSEKSKYWLPSSFPPMHQLPPSLCPPVSENVTVSSEWGK